MDEPTKKIYEAITNYINNDVGLKKEDILAYIDQRLDNFIDQWIQQRSMRESIDELIISRITNYLNNGFANPDTFGRNYYSSKDKVGFEMFVKQQIKAQVIEIVDAKMKEVLKL